MGVLTESILDFAGVQWQFQVVHVRIICPIYVTCCIYFGAKSIIFFYTPNWMQNEGHVSSILQSALQPLEYTTIELHPQPLKCTCSCSSTSLYVYVHVCFSSNSPNRMMVHCYIQRPGRVPPHPHAHTHVVCMPKKRKPYIPILTDPRWGIMLSLRGHTGTHRFLHAYVYIVLYHCESSPSPIATRLPYT